LQSARRDLTLAGMDEHDLTPAQAKELAERIRPMLAYLYALKRRIDERHFPPGDQLRRRVERAYDELHRLWIDLHYKSCPGSTGE
jgi:hypothetical protein